LASSQRVIVTTVLTMPSARAWIASFTSLAAYAGAAEIGEMLRLMGGRPETALGLPGVGDMYVTSTGGRNVKAGRLVGSGLTFGEAHERLEHVTMEGAAAIKVIGGALAKMTARGVVDADAFPLRRHLYEVIVEEKPLALPWDKGFEGSAALRRS
jgi:glycerol-3-phosphate dehydrogenase (NAD(P)+)